LFFGRQKFPENGNLVFWKELVVVSRKQEFGVLEGTSCSIDKTGIWCFGRN
jgi:hypothetical protein